MDPYIRHLVEKGRGAQSAPDEHTTHTPRAQRSLSGKIVPFDETRRAELSEIRAAASALVERFQFYKQAGITFNGMRDLYEILGYDRIITTLQYRDRYARGGVAGRIAEVFPNACWRGDVEIIEDEDPENTTDFEQAWMDLEIQLKVLSVLRRADILSQLSYYSIILIGARGNGALSTELPKGKPGQLLYLSPYSGGGGPGLSSGGFYSRDGGGGVTYSYGDATIHEFENDIKSPRFGLPRFYQLRRVDAASPELQVPVHWSRVIHIAEGCLDNEVYGYPRLERVWNLLDDLEKVTGGGAEAFWLRANQGLHLDIDKDLQNLSQSEKDSLRDQADEYQHQMRRMLRTRGVNVTPLGSDVANFSNPADAVLTQIAGSLSIPKRILTGSEMGELASSQDRDNWIDQVNGRQKNFCAPYILRQLIDRLVEYGYLPTPKKGSLAYHVKWPHAQTLTESERAEGALKWASVNQTNGTPIFTEDEIRDKWYAMAPMTPEQLQSILDRKMKMMPPQLQPPALQEEEGEPEEEPGQKEPPTARAAQASVDEELLTILGEAIRSNNVTVVNKILGIGANA